MAQGIDVGLLDTRLAAVAGRLAVMKRTLDEVGAREWMGDRTRTWFANEVESLTREIVRLRGRDGDGRRSWRELRAVERGVETFLEQARAVLSGAYLLEVGDTQGLYQAADDLLTELGSVAGEPWSGLVVPSRRWVVENRPGIIHLPVPMVGPWELPVLAHEFGHVVEGRLEGRRGFLDVRNEVVSNASPARASELFADVFATWVMGPSFAFASFLLRFSPDGGGGPADGSHPPDEQRARWILETLRRRGAALDDSRWDSTVVELERLWESSVPAAAWDDGDETGPEAGDAPTEDAAALVSRFCGFLEDLPSLAYDGWSRAWTLRGALGPERPGPVALPVGTTIRDVLNAGWLARVAWPGEQRKIATEIAATLRELRTHPV